MTDFDDEFSFNDEELPPEEGLSQDEIAAIMAPEELPAELEELANQFDADNISEPTDEYPFDDNEEPITTELIEEGSSSPTVSELITPSSESSESVPNVVDATTITSSVSNVEVAITTTAIEEESASLQDDEPNQPEEIVSEAEQPLIQNRKFKYTLEQATLALNKGMVPLGEEFDGEVDHIIRLEVNTLKQEESFRQYYPLSFANEQLVNINTTDEPAVVQARYRLVNFISSQAKSSPNFNHYIQNKNFQSYCDAYVGYLLNLDNFSDLYEFLSAPQVDSLAFIFRQFALKKSIVLRIDEGISQTKTLSALARYATNALALPFAIDEKRTKRNLVYLCRDKELINDFFVGLFSSQLFDSYPDVTLLSTHLTHSIDYLSLPNTQQLIGKPNYSAGKSDLIVGTFKDVDKRLLASINQDTIVILHQCDSLAQYDITDPIIKVIRSIVEKTSNIVYLQHQQPNELTPWYLYKGLFSPEEWFTYFVAATDYVNQYTVQYLSQSLTSNGGHLSFSPNLTSIGVDYLYPRKTDFNYNQYAKSNSDLCAIILNEIQDLSLKVKELITLRNERESASGEVRHAFDVSSISHEVMEHVLFCFKIYAVFPHITTLLENSCKVVFDVKNSGEDLFFKLLEHNLGIFELNQAIDHAAQNPDDQEHLSTLLRTRNKIIREYFKQEITITSNSKPSIKNMLRWLLDACLTIHISREGESTRSYYQTRSPALLQHKEHIENLINQIDGFIAAFPIDWLRFELKQRNYLFAEITTRICAMDIDRKHKTWHISEDYNPSLAQPEVIQNDFQEGEVDVLLVERKYLKTLNLKAIEPYFIEKTDYLRQRVLIPLHRYNDTKELINNLNALSGLSDGKTFIEPSLRFIDIGIFNDTVSNLLTLDDLRKFSINTEYRFHEYREDENFIHPTDLMAPVKKLNGFYGSEVLTEYLGKNPTLRSITGLEYSRPKNLNVQTLLHLLNLQLNDEQIRLISNISDYYDAVTYAKQYQDNLPYIERELTSQVTLGGSYLLDTDINQLNKKKLYFKNIRYLKISDPLSLNEIITKHTDAIEPMAERLLASLTIIYDTCNISPPDNLDSFIDRLSAYRDLYEELAIECLYAQCLNYLLDEHGDFKLEQHEKANQLKAYFGYKATAERQLITESLTNFKKTVPSIYTAIEIIADKQLVKTFNDAFMTLKFLNKYLTTVKHADSAGIKTSPNTLLMVSVLPPDALTTDLSNIEPEYGALVEMHFPDLTPVALSPEAFLIDVALPDKSSTKQVPLSYFLNTHYHYFTQFDLLCALSDEDIAIIGTSMDKTVFKESAMLRAQKQALSLPVSHDVDYTFEQQLHNSNDIIPLTTMVHLDHPDFAKAKSLLNHHGRYVSERKLNVITGDLVRATLLFAPHFSISKVSFNNEYGVLEHGIILPADITHDRALSICQNTVALNQLMDYVARLIDANDPKIKTLPSITIKNNDLHMLIDNYGYFHTQNREKFPACTIKFYGSEHALVELLKTTDLHSYLVNMIFDNNQDITQIGSAKILQQNLASVLKTLLTSKLFKVAQFSSYDSNFIQEMTHIKAS